jgi:starch synthase
MFVIHNMAHQGRGPMVEVQNLELSDHYKEMFRWGGWVGGGCTCSSF